jgi:hypothetical protein
VTVAFNFISECTVCDEAIKNYKVFIVFIKFSDFFYVHNFH